MLQDIDIVPSDIFQDLYTSEISKSMDIWYDLLNSFWNVGSRKAANWQHG